MNAWYRVENAEEIPSPTLLIYPERIRDNIRETIRWVGNDHVDRLRPHVKTHKMPQLIQMKLEAGIRKFKTATISESEMTASAGAADVMLAYQPVGPNIQRFIRLVKEFPGTTFSTIVDDIQIVTLLSQAAVTADVEIPVYIDLNLGMNRTGIAPDESAAELFRQIRSTAGLLAAGFHAYDGHLHETDEDILRQQAREAFEPVWELRKTLSGETDSAIRIVGCGTPTSKLMAEETAAEDTADTETADMEISPGTSVLWDAGQPTFNPPVDIVNAAVLLARVISRPRPDLLCIDLGYKAVASEMQPPRVRFFGLEDAEPVMQSEEHLVLRTERSDDFALGQTLYGIPTHICPTVALHQSVWCVRDHRAIERWPVVARDRFLTI